MTTAFIVVLILCVLRIGANANSYDDAGAVTMSVLADLVIAGVAIWGLVR